MFLLRTARAAVVALPKPTSSLLRGRSSLIPSTSSPLRSNNTSFSSAFSTTTSLSNSSDYGSGDANTKTDRSKATKDSEHPGPAPPSTSSGGGEKKQQTSSSEGGSGGGGDKPQPKILNAKHPQEGEEPEDVKKHNEEMKQNREKQAQ